MKEFDDILYLFPEMPAACDEALNTALKSLPEKRRSFTFTPRRTAAILLAALMALCCVAGAAFAPRIAAWFAGHYGASYGEWVAGGNLAQPNASVTENGAVFTIDEVAARSRGLYVLGTIRPEEGYLILDSECSTEEPFGYNIHYGETAPEGTLSFAEKAQAEGKALRFVHCDLRSIGVDGGAMLVPGSWGYGARMQPDGSIVFTMEIEDGMTVQPGSEYTLELCATTWDASAGGYCNYENGTEQVFTVTVVPTSMDEQ